MTIKEKFDLFLPPVVKDAYIKNLETLNPVHEYAEWFLDSETTSFTGGFVFDRSPEGQDFWVSMNSLFESIEKYYTENK